MNAVLKQDPAMQLPRAEILRLGAVDSIFYSHHFFPKTFRLKSPEFHRDFWFHFEDPGKDLFGAEIYRDGAKTTLTRAGLSKRIAYATSRTILCVCINETMATHSVRWLRHQIETESYWTRTFQLRKGAKWSDDWIEIINVPFDLKINLVAKGMTSGLRGLNLDDYRPDFIFCDDISNEETTGTEEQRIKNKELFFGTLVPALAPKSEAPNRKLVLCQTGLHKEDIINQAHGDPAFYTVKYPKLVYDAQSGEPKSSWPERFSLDAIMKEREQYTLRNQFHIWLREFGCKIISRETAPLQANWLRRWTTLPTNLIYFGGLDPAVSKRKEAHRTAGGKIGIDTRSGDVFLISYFAQVGKNPDEMWKWVIEECIQSRTGRVRKMGVETIAFQKFLAWYFKQKMQETKTFFVIDEIEDRRSKDDRIIQAFSGIGSQGHLYVSDNHTDFIRGFEEWTEGTDWDLGDAVAQAITLALGLAASSIDMEDITESMQEEENEMADIEYEGGAP